MYYCIAFSFFLLIGYFVYTVCIKLFDYHMKHHPCVVACENLKSKLENRSYRNNQVLHHHLEVSTLDTFNKYKSADYADLWLDRYAKKNPNTMKDVLDALWNNTLLTKAVSEEFDKILAQYQPSSSVYQYIQNNYEPIFRSEALDYYHLMVTYTSPAGRNHYRQDWYWDSNDIVGFMVYVSSPKMEVPPDSPKCSVYNGQSVSYEIHKPQSASQVNHSQTVQSRPACMDLLLPVKESCLSPDCVSYIHAHRCYNINEYKRAWNTAGQKRVVPGCYIILDCNVNKIYVGQAQNLKIRMNQHLHGKDSDKPDNIDYAIAVLQHSILIRHIPLGRSGYYDLNEMERHLIEAYDCQYPKGYNKTKGNGY